MAFDSDRPDIPVDPATADFEKVVAESKERLAAEPPPPRQKNKINGKIKKDGRGRPTKEEADARAAEAEAARQSQANEFASALAPALEHAVAMPFDYGAQKTGFPGWSLSAEEKKALAQQADAVIRQYLPQIPSEHAALVSFAASLGIIGVARWLEYSRWLAARAAEAGKAPVIEPTPRYT